MTTPPGYQPSALLTQALRQVEAVRSLYTFTKIEETIDYERQRSYDVYQIRQSSLPGVPPPSIQVAPPLERKTLDTATYHGLGVVGLWAAINAFTERKKSTTKYQQALPQDLFDVLGELDDLRNLYAHNFAGVADLPFFQNANHRINPQFQQGVTRRLLTNTGTVFDGSRVSLTIADLAAYCDSAKRILEALDKKWR